MKRAVTPKEPLGIAAASRRQPNLTHDSENPLGGLSELAPADPNDGLRDEAKTEQSVELEIALTIPANSWRINHLGSRKRPKFVHKNLRIVSNLSSHPRPTHSANCTPRTASQWSAQLGEMLALWKYSVSRFLRIRNSAAFGHSSADLFKFPAVQRRRGVWEHLMLLDFDVTGIEHFELSRGFAKLGKMALSQLSAKQPLRSDLIFPDVQGFGVSMIGFQTPHGCGRIGCLVQQRWKEIFFLVCRMVRSRFAEIA